MPLFLSSLRHALRSFLRTPGFTVTVLLTLALGLGANTAMFSVIDAMVLRPLPYPEADRLVALYALEPKEGNFLLSAPDFFDWRDGARDVEGMALYREDTQDLGGTGEAESVPVLQVSRGFFELLRARPLLGRTFQSPDEPLGSPTTILLSHGLWSRRFGANPQVIGQSVLLGGTPMEVLGVLGPDFRFPGSKKAEVYRVIRRDPEGRNRGAHSFKGLARLRPGATLDQARADLARMAQAVNERNPRYHTGWSATLDDFHTEVLGEGRRPLLLLLGAAGLLLLITCTNVANLFLARSVGRIREVAIRRSQGAEHRHLLTQFLAEGVLMGLGGGLLGLGLAQGILRILPELLPGVAQLNHVQAMGLEPTVLAYALVLSLGCSLVFALVPVLHARGLRPIQLGPQATQGGGRVGKLRSLLVFSEVAMATLLLLGSGLLLHSFFKVFRTHPGFDTHQVVTFEVATPAQQAKEDRGKRAFQAELTRRLAALPGVQRVTCTGGIPLGDDSRVAFSPGPADLPMDQWPATDFQIADAGYLETLRVPLLAGQNLRVGDTVPRVLVNATFARTFFPRGDALGKPLQFGYESERAPVGTPFEIAGILGDQRSVALHKPPRPSVILPQEFIPPRVASFLLRTEHSAAALAGAIRAQVAAVDGSVAVRNLTDMDTVLREHLGDRRHLLTLLGGFTLLALLLSGIGIYGVVSHTVAQRTQEFGLRMALGAQVAQVLRMVLGQGLSMVALGGALGVLLFLGLRRLLEAHLYGITPSDPQSAGLALALLFATALLACCIPALRAARVDPMVALRNE